MPSHRAKSRTFLIFMDIVELIAAAFVGAIIGILLVLAGLNLYLAL